MPQSFFFRLFPVPTYLARSAAGLDLSDRSVKFIILAPGGSGPCVKASGEKEIPVGLIEAGQIKKSEELIQILRELKTERRLHHVVAALPEEQVYVIRLRLPFIQRRELRSSIELQLEDYVPIPVAEAVFDYEILTEPRRKNESFDLAVSVVPRSIVETYLRVFHSAGLWPLAFEMEAQAIVRAVVPRTDQETLMVLDLGKTRTSFFVVRKGVLLFTSTFNTLGGDSLTRAVQKNLACSLSVAEQLKIEQGLLRSKRDNKLIFALLPLASVLKDEILKLYNYWNTGAASHGRPERISRLLLCGGQATLPGLVEYLSTYLEVPVELANVWVNLTPIQRRVPPITFNQAQKYAAALGLALRNFSLNFL